MDDGRATDKLGVYEGKERKEDKNGEMNKSRKEPQNKKDQSLYTISEEPASANVTRVSNIIENLKASRYEYA